MPTDSKKKSEPRMPMGLCRRCEWRARFYETGSGPRCECQCEKSAVHSCYMYKPTLPYIMTANEGDDRPEYGPAFISARMHAVRPASEDELHLKGIRLKSGILVWHERVVPIKKRRVAKPPR